ncbi:MAG: hypothetical protein ACXVRV_13345 [Gaiellaceae bacterium]
MKLNRTALEYAERVIEGGRVVYDVRDDWSEHQPSAEEENRFTAEHGFAEYARWHLGVEDEKDERTKSRYEFPYGDFERLHRCALLAPESRAEQYKYADIELAIAHLHGLVEASAARAR